MQRRAGQWRVRLVGSLFGLAACAIGFASLLGAPGVGAIEQERAAGFGVTAVVVGAIALVASLAVRDARALWYCSPRRWGPFKADVLDEPDDREGPPEAKG
jgi:hypothetical protein